MQESAQEIHDKDIRFSDSAKAELCLLMDALKDILDRSFSCFIADDVDAALTVEPLEETIDRLIEEVRMRHIQRLQTGGCTIQLGFILSDLLTNFERVSDHCSNIAVCVLEERDVNLDRHAYLHDLKSDSTFTRRLTQDLETYRLPQL